MDGFGAKSRLAVLLEGFGEVADARAPWRVAHPLPEVLLFVVYATIADRLKALLRRFKSRFRLDPVRREPIQIRLRDRPFGRLRRAQFHHGAPWRLIVTFSPFKARSISLERLFFASATENVVMAR